MIKFLWAIAITIVSSTLSVRTVHAQFTDNFSDGDFTNTPSWEGTVSKFTVIEDQLQLQAPPEDSEAFLATASNAINDAVWEFSVRMEFNPSGANYARIYVSSDQPDLSSSLNGYYVLIGGTSDEVSLYKQVGATHSRIIDGADGSVNLSAVAARIRVTRSVEGNWELYSDIGLSGTYNLEGSANDLTHSSSSYFGIYCDYTATRADKFSFDDFEVVGEPYVENESNVNHKDVIITEILADPTPIVGLPEAEFIEIFNRSSSEINLNNWTISDGTSTARLPAKMLLPNDYLVIVSSSSLGYFSIQNIVGVSSFPSLNNTGDIIVLESQFGVMIDSIKYSDSWYKDSEKKEGGWSLEIIDINNPCGEEDNWIAADDVQGGTPGIQNSVYASKPDVNGPSLIQAVAISPTQLKLQFDEKLADEEVLPESISIDPSLPVSQVIFSDNALRTLNVTLGSEIHKGVLYTVAVSSVRDCNLNLIREENSGLEFALPEKADSLDILINEILFNPWPTGVDFVELYNNSSKYINLKGWKLGNLGDGTIENERIITESDLLLQPSFYMVITSDPEKVIGQYPNSVIDNFWQSDLPSLPDDKGSLVLVNDEGGVVDGITYGDDFHSPLIKDDEGVSLERVSFATSSNDPQNWKSASTTAGYATPGFINSNSRGEISGMLNAIKVDPEIFQPVYGQPNFTRIQYKFDNGGYVVNAKIVDAGGRTIKVLANNDILGTDGFYRWDGDLDNGAKARIGYYFVWFEVYDLSGDVRTYRKRIVISGQF